LKAKYPEELITNVLIDITENELLEEDAISKGETK